MITDDCGRNVKAAEPSSPHCICLCAVTFSECMFVSPNVLFVITSDVLYICVNL